MKEILHLLEFLDKFYCFDIRPSHHFICLIPHCKNSEVLPPSIFITDGSRSLLVTFLHRTSDCEIGAHLKSIKINSPFQSTNYIRLAQCLQYFSVQGTFTESNYIVKKRRNILLRQSPTPILSSVTLAVGLSAALSASLWVPRFHLRFCFRWVRSMGLLLLTLSDESCNKTIKFD